VRRRVLLPFIEHVAGPLAHLGRDACWCHPAYAAPFAQPFGI